MLPVAYAMMESRLRPEIKHEAGRTQIRLRILPRFHCAFAQSGCSPGTAAYLADSQRLRGFLVYPKGLPVQLDPSSIPSYSFHSAHIDRYYAWPLVP
jgi:hypothetical protein